MMRVSRIFPDFSSQTGQAKIQLDLKDFPNDTSASSSLGPFTVDANTKKIDSRARGRFISLKIFNDAVSQFWKVGTFRIDYNTDGRR